MNAWTLHHGDCLTWLPTLPAGQAEAVITDPPYGVGYTSHKKLAKDRRVVLNDERPFIWWLHHAARALRDPGALLCFCRWDVQEIFRLAIEAAGLEVRSQLVWDREQHGSGLVTRDLAPQHDVAWFAVKGEFAFHAKRPHSVIRALKPHYTASVHPTEKPLALMLELVTALVRPGGLVLDPFAGSGSTGEACIVSGRKFLGCELDEGHWRRATARLQQAAPLFAGGRERQGELGTE